MIELVKDKEAEMHLEGRPLVLIPLVFARGVLMGESEDEQAVALGYQARGTAALWTAEAAGFDGRLELLLGHGRAAVLRALDRPATTTDLARRLSYAPSTVSAHLDVLSRPGWSSATAFDAASSTASTTPGGRSSCCWPTSRQP